MNTLKLDMKQLLGFKVVSADIAAGQGYATALHRAKIGAKTDITQLAQQSSKPAA